MLASFSNDMAARGMAAALVVIALSITAPACTDETGILVEVSKGQITDKPDTLRFYVGVSIDDLVIDVPGCGSGPRFVDDAIEADSEVSVSDRDLASDPYRLLLKPGDELGIDDDVMVAVAALAGEEVLGLAALDQPVGFVDGKVLEWKLALAGGDNVPAMTGAGCVCAQASTGGAVIIAPTTDQDCDGDVGADDCDPNNAYVGKTKPEICANQLDDNCNGATDEVIDADSDQIDNCTDCDDTNPNVYPGAPEICDGYDNNCLDSDGRYPDHVECYATDSGDCYMGKRLCNDYDPLGEGWLGECAPVGLDPLYRGSGTLCEAFGACTQAKPYEESFECANDQVFTDVLCELLLYDAGNGSYAPCPGGVTLPGPVNIDAACWWTLMGGVEQDPYQVILKGVDGNVGEGAVVDSCRPSLMVIEVGKTPPEIPETGIFHLWLEADQIPYYHYRMYVTPQIVQDALACPPEQGIICADLPLPQGN